MKKFCVVLGCLLAVNIVLSVMNKWQEHQVAALKGTQAVSENAEPPVKQTYRVTFRVAPEVQSTVKK